MHWVIAGWSANSPGSKSCHEHTARTVKSLDGGGPSGASQRKTVPENVHFAPRVF